MVYSSVNTIFIKKLYKSYVSIQYAKIFRQHNQIISSDMLSVFITFIENIQKFSTVFVSTPKLNFGVSIDIFALFCIIKI